MVLNANTGDVLRMARPLLGDQNSPDNVDASNSYCTLSTGTAVSRKGLLSDLAIRVNGRKPLSPGCALKCAEHRAHPRSVTK
jgi:hypothetical protein